MLNICNRMNKLIKMMAASLLLCAGFSLRAQEIPSGTEWQDINLDCTSLTETNHPRLFLADEDIRNIKKNLSWHTAPDNDGCGGRIA